MRRVGTRARRKPDRHAPPATTERRQLPLAVAVDDNEEHDVEAIIDVKLVKGVAKYKVKWLDFDHSHNSWIFYAQFTDKKIVTAFQKEHRKATKDGFRRALDDQKEIGRVFLDMSKKIHASTRKSYAHQSIRAFPNCMYKEDTRSVTVSCNTTTWRMIEVPVYCAEATSTGYDFQVGEDLQNWILQHYPKARHELGQLLEPRLLAPFEHTGYHLWQLSAGAQLDNQKTHVMTRLPNHADGGTRLKCITAGEACVWHSTAHSPLVCDRPIRVRHNAAAGTMTITFTVVNVSGADADFLSCDLDYAVDSDASRSMELGDGKAPPASMLFPIQDQAFCTTDVCSCGLCEFKHSKQHMHEALTVEVRAKCVQMEQHVTRHVTSTASATEWKVTIAGYHRRVKHYEFDTWLARSKDSIKILLCDPQWTPRGCLDPAARSVWAMWMSTLHAVFRLRGELFTEVDAAASRLYTRFPVQHASRVGSPMISRTSRAEALRKTPPSKLLESPPKKSKARKLCDQIPSVPMLLNMQEHAALMAERGLWEMKEYVRQDDSAHQLAGGVEYFWENTETGVQMDKQPACLRHSDEELQGRIDAGRVAAAAAAEVGRRAAAAEDAAVAAAHAAANAGTTPAEEAYDQTRTHDRVWRAHTQGVTGSS
jgi:hypothetical protein